jgi:hypothetical protein
LATIQKKTKGVRVVIVTVYDTIKKEIVTRVTYGTVGTVNVYVGR